MRPYALHHVSINVTDVDAARDFYTRVLGLTERTDRPDFSFGGHGWTPGASRCTSSRPRCHRNSGSTSRWP